MIAGTFAVSGWFASLASIAVVLAAIYLLWSYQRVAHGPVREEHRALPDVSRREVVVLAPVLALLLVFGVAPGILTRDIDPATRRVVEHVAPPHETDIGADLLSPGAAVAAGEGEAPSIQTPRLIMQPVLPELVLAAVGMIGLLYEAFARRSSIRVHLGIALVGLLGAGVAAWRLWDWSAEPVVLGDAVAVDRFAVVGVLIVVVSAAIGCLIATTWFDRDPAAYRGELYPLVLFAASGMALIVVANDLIVTFLALEILSLSLYVLTGLGAGSRSTEAAVKYFLLGAFASAVFLYGIAMSYGATGTTKIAEIGRALAGGTGSLSIALVGMVLLAIGFAFKVSAAPFHMWTPDVYQGAPTPITAFMSAATKTAAFLAFTRVFMVGFQPLTWDWVPLVGAIAVLSVVLGSVVAIAQRDVKRMLAYSIDRARRVHPHGPDERDRGRDAGRDVLPGRLQPHDARRLRHGAARSPSAARSGRTWRPTAGWPGGARASRP